MRKILCTGGEGYIGQEVIKSLFVNGFAPISVDIKNGYDLRFWSPEAMLIKEDIDTVIHLASYTSNPESVHMPIPYYMNNIITTINMLKAMKPGDRFIFASSAAVYGTPGISVTINEGSPIRPITPYGRSKACCEDIIRDVCKAMKIEFIILRLFNVAGGNNPSKDALIPKLIQTVKEGGTFLVYGKDYATPDGTPKRDFVHVEDVADAFVKSVCTPAKDMTFNIGSGESVSVDFILEEMTRKLMKRIKRVYSPRRTGDVAEIVSDISYAQNVLGFTPHHNIASIIESELKNKMLA